MTRFQQSGSLVRILAPAGSSLREGRSALVLTVGLTASAMALFVAVQALRGHEPMLAPLGAASTMVPWTDHASPPSVTQANAIHAMLEVLRAIAWTALALAMVTVLIRFQVLAVRRGGDLGIRRAVGASRADILGSLVMESAVTALLAAVAGRIALALILAVAGTFWPGAPIHFHPTFTTGAVIVIGVLLAGALSPLRFLRDRHMHGQADGTVPLGLPTFQLAVSLALVMGSALLLGNARDRGVTGPRENGVIVQLDTGVTGNADRAAAYARLVERVRLAGPSADVSLTAPGGLVGLGTVDNVTTNCGQCMSGGVFVPYHHTEAVHLFVSPDWFAVRRARIIAGRAITPADAWGGKRVAVVNRHLAERHFESGNAVGREMWLGADLRREPFEVVGIVDDAPSDALGGALQPRQAVYLSVLQLPPREADLLVRADAPMDRAALLATIEDTLGTGRVHGVLEENDYRAAESAPVRWFGGWLAAAALVVLLTSAAGTFSTVRWWVESLSGELSLRRAVGASRVRIAGFVLSRATGIGAGGVALGLFLFFSVVRGSLTALVPGLPIWNRGVFGVAVVVFGAVALMAAVLPTWNLLRGPPIRNEMTD